MIIAQGKMNEDVHFRHPHPLVSAHIHLKDKLFEDMDNVTICSVHAIDSELTTNPDSMTCPDCDQRYGSLKLFGYPASGRSQQ